MKRWFLPILLSAFLLSFVGSIAQVRVAVFPFRNMDGNLKLNIWCYQLQDSLMKALIKANEGAAMYAIVPADSIEMMLTELNIDPSNPQYETDMWTVAKKLNCKKVVTGNFNYQAERFLINAYIYDVKLKLAHPNYQARDIFKSEQNIYEAVNEIVESLLPAFQIRN